jgi:hypothetical protein
MTRPKSSFSRLKFVIGLAFSTLSTSNISVSFVLLIANVLSTRKLSKCHVVGSMPVEVLDEEWSGRQIWKFSVGNDSRIRKSALIPEVDRGADLVRKLVPSERLQMVGRRALAVGHGRVRVEEKIDADWIRAQGIRHAPILGIGCPELVTPLVVAADVHEAARR